MQNQRDRILRAVADVVSVAGYSEMSVEDIIATAGVSRRTFYDHFRNKDDAFLAQYDVIAGTLIERVRAADDAELPLAARGDACLSAVIEFFVEEPSYADMCIVESLAAGTEAIARRDMAIHALANLIDEAVGDIPKRLRPPAITAQALVGGIYEVMHSRILAGELAALPGLVPDMLYALLLPFMGIEEAEQGAQTARRRYKKARAARTAPSGT